jgi:hypothetical protein
MDEERIAELEDALTANDEYLQEVEALNAELVAALKQLESELNGCSLTLMAKIATNAILKAEEANE